jgi:hypothetical protein
LIRIEQEYRRVVDATGMQRRSSLDLFNKFAGMQLDMKTASADALDAVRARRAVFVCWWRPMSGHGLKATAPT